MKKIMLVFGTRPEAIKMCPLVNEIKHRPYFHEIVCVTGQHQRMLNQVLSAFQVVPQYNLSIMKQKQDLFDITTEILTGMKSILQKEKPDMVLVHGDTTTTFSTALASFYLKIPVGHVEAGLRTYNIYSPYPEELNRQAVGNIAQYHFAPTQNAAKNLLREGKKADQIFITGNTAIDALRTTVKRSYYHPVLQWAADSRLVLLTAHRRENWGIPLQNILHAIRRIVREFPDIKVIYPVHPNPIVREIAYQELGDEPHVRLIEPMDVVDFHNFMARSTLILTDSGGIQEEAPSLGKPVLVMRDTTERPEGVQAGTLKLVGTDEDGVYQNFKCLLTNHKLYESMSKSNNPYGDGNACKRIADILERALS